MSITERVGLETWSRYPLVVRVSEESDSDAAALVGGWIACTNKLADNARIRR